MPPPSAVPAQQPSGHDTNTEMETPVSAAAARAAVLRRVAAPTATSTSAAEDAVLSSGDTTAVVSLTNETIPTVTMAAEAVAAPPFVLTISAVDDDPVALRVATVPPQPDGYLTPHPVFLRYRASPLWLWRQTETIMSYSAPKWVYPHAFVYSAYVEGFALDCVHRVLVCESTHLPRFGVGAFGRFTLSESGTYIFRNLSPRADYEVQWRVGDGVWFPTEPPTIRIPDTPPVIAPTAAAAPATSAPTTATTVPAESSWLSLWPKTKELSATVVYTYTAKYPTELTVTENDQVTIIKAVDENWFKCRGRDGATGNVPKNHLELTNGPSPQLAMTPRHDIVLD